MQADPQPEVGRVDAQLPLDPDDVRRDQQQLAAGPVEELELAQHLAGQEAEHHADLHTGHPAADRFGHPADRVGGGEPVDRAESSRCACRGVDVDPGGPVDDPGERRDRRLDQAGQVGDMAGGGAAALIELAHGVVGLVAGHRGRRWDSRRAVRAARSQSISEAMTATVPSAAANPYAGAR